MKKRVYTVTYDRPLNGNYDRVFRRLRRIGFMLRLVTKTTYVIELFPGATFSDLKNALVAVMDRVCGTVVMISSRTGNIFQMNNRGNRRGKFVRVEP